MRCHDCDYPLWNLGARQCPECGKPFRIGAHEFVPNSVRFCCQHCDQAYYGTGEHGHVVPTEFDCVGCGNRIHMEDMVLRPAAGVEEDQTRVERMPWLERAKSGRVRSWLHMVGRGMTGPHRIMKALPAQARPGQAWWFAIVTWSIYSFLGFGVPFAVIATIELIRQDLSDVLGLGATSVVFTIGVTTIALAWLLVWGLCTHWLLRISGGCAGSLGRTFEALCYSCGPCVLLAVPCIGPYCFSWAGLVWWMVAAVLMVAMVHNVHGGRAAFATLMLPGVVTMLSVAGYFGWLFFFLTWMGGPTGPMASARPVTGTAEVQSVTDEVRNYALLHDGAGPRHASMLMLDTIFSGDNFVMKLSDSTTTGIPVADVTLSDLATLTGNRRRLTIEQAAEAVPDGVLAHRLGDFVFTYHGIDVTTDDPGLWLLVMAPDPSAGTHPSLDPAVLVGRVDGSVVVFPVEDFGAALAAQNALRAGVGLAPLPPVETVTHDAPAR